MQRGRMNSWEGEQCIVVEEGRVKRMKIGIREW
jgi:hypothetical protein